jgi:hypothetical protein
MLHYHWVILHAILYIVSYPGGDLCFTLFEIPLECMVFVIVGQSLLILKRLKISNRNKKQIEIRGGGG